MYACILLGSSWEIFGSVIAARATKIRNSCVKRFILFTCVGLLCCSFKRQVAEANILDACLELHMISLNQPWPCNCVRTIISRVTNGNRRFFYFLNVHIAKWRALCNSAPINLTPIIQQLYKIVFFFH